MPQETLVYFSEAFPDAGMGYDISDIIEKAIGNMSEEATVKEMGGRLGNAKASAYVNAIGQKLVRLSSRKDYGYKFDIVKNKTPNAFALPNGSIYVTDGLLRLMRTETQLANVLGHEVAHVTERHSLDQIKTNLAARGGLSILSKLFSSILGGAVSKEDQENAKELSFELIANGYSRSRETEADKVGQSLAAKAGWDPIGMVDVMTIFQSLEKERPKGVEAYTRSHPYAGDRVKAAQERLPRLPEGGKIGESEYRSFLEEVLGVSEDEAKLSPTEAGLKTLPEEKVLKYLPGQEAFPTTTPSWLIPVLAVGGGILILVGVYFLMRRK